MVKNTSLIFFGGKKKLIWRMMEKGSNERKTRAIKAANGKVRGYSHPDVRWEEFAQHEVHLPAAHPFLNSELILSDRFSPLNADVGDPGHPWAHRVAQFHQVTTSQPNSKHMSS